MANKMRVAQVTRAGGPLEIVERPIPEPPADWVRIKVQACGICHSDSLVKEGLWPGLKYPRVPGHEVMGVVDALGEGVTQWKVGERVGVGWHGGNCGHCDNCRRGDFFACTVDLKVTGISFDGGYGEYMSLRHHSRSRACRMNWRSVDGAPLMCARASPHSTLLRNTGVAGESRRGAWV